LLGKLNPLQETELWFLVVLVDNRGMSHPLDNPREIIHDNGSTRFERWAAPIAGVVSVIVGLGVGSTTAGLLKTTSPMTSLATSVIDNAPRTIERWAIRSFGTNDKTVLAWSVAVVLLIAGALVGRRARQNPRAAVIGAALLAIIGCVISLAGRTAGLKGLVPVVAASVAGGFALVMLTRVLDPFKAASTGNDVASGPRLDRRRFLGLGGASAVGGLVLQQLGTSIGTQGLGEGQRKKAAAAINSAKGPAVTIPAPPEGSDLGVPGLTPFRVPNDNFYRIDTAFSIPRLNADDWSMTIGGMVNQERKYTYQDLVKRASLARDVTLMCVSNEIGGDLVGNAYFQGVPLKELLEECGPQTGAEQVFSTSVDGWTCGFPLEVAMDGRDAMIAVLMNGEPLPYMHGFPARLVVPGIYGYVSATKWLDRIDVNKWSDAEGFWIPRGWSQLAPVKTASRIDVPQDRATVASGIVAVAGVAWAQHRGIGKVEVQVNDGQWTEATMATAGSKDTWRQWKFAWDAAAAGKGSHVIRVRASDLAGELQPLGPAPVAPDGAEGFHSIRVKVS
jgi:DMSO/TMAO reductase YedYZ molybdopterin-dependent catalytic subunit